MRQGQHPSLLMACGTITWKACGLLWQSKAVVSSHAGEPIGTRWTPAIKAEIKRSRVGVTRAIVVRRHCCPALHFVAGLALVGIQSHACLLHMALMCCVTPLVDQGCGAWQDAIKACPEGQRPEVLVSTSAIGAPMHSGACFVVSARSSSACML